MKCSPLTTNRLILREFKGPDWKPVHEYASDPDVVRYLTWGPNSKEDSHFFIQRVISYQEDDPRRNHEFAVILEKEDRLIGACGLCVSNPDHKEAWIGYCFNRHFWGKGYATEAIKALLEFGFSKLGLHRIFATSQPDNIASAHVLGKVGMRREGHLRQHLWVKGKWRDSFLHAVLDHEWKVLVERETK